MRCIVFGDNHNVSVSLDRLPIADALYLHLGDLCHGDPDSARRSIDKVRELGAHCVLGSHDRPLVDDEALQAWKALAERMSGSGNIAAAKIFSGFFYGACRLREALEDEYLDFIRKLPGTIELDLDGRRAIAVHDALVDMGNRRILTVERAEANFAARDFDVLFHGHTHTPSMYELSPRGGITEKFFKLDDRRAAITAANRSILNPGSLSAIRGYPGTNKNSMLLEDGDLGSPTGMATFAYGSYGIFDTEADRFEVVFFETESE